MPSLHTEIGIMVAILVGAWACKVLAVALYMYCHRRRLERLGLQSEDAPPRVCTCHKSTPAHVIKALPILPYTKAMQQLHGVHTSSHAGKTASAAQPATQQQQELDTDTVAVADQSSQQQQQQQQAGQVTTYLCRSSVASVPGAAARSSSSQRLQSSSSSTSGTDTDCCPVCFTEYEPTTAVRQLPCKHFYHTECIDAWLNRDNTCPLCKSVVWMPAADDNSSSRSITATPAAGQLDSLGDQQQHRHAPAVVVAPRLLQIIVIGGRGTRDSLSRTER